MTRSQSLHRIQLQTGKLAVTHQLLAVAQWIVHMPPKRGTLVRFQSARPTRPFFACLASVPAYNGAGLKGAERAGNKSA